MADKKDTTTAIAFTSLIVTLIFGVLNVTLTIIGLLLIKK